LAGDLDFWVCNYADYTNAFVEMVGHYDKFSMYPSMIEMEDSNGILPNINLIYTKLSPNTTVDRFDFTYCQCYWNTRLGLVVSPQAAESIGNKYIPWTNPTSPHAIKYKRILKAVKYGYRFTHDFWFQLKHLISNPDKIPTTRSRKPWDIKLEDLDLAKFELKQIPIQITSKANVTQTLKEIANQYKQIALTPNTKLPVLIEFTNKEIGLMGKYMNTIIQQNPLKDTHYLEVRIGTHFVNYSDKYKKYFLESEPKFKPSKPEDPSILTDDEDDEIPRLNKSKEKKEKLVYNKDYEESDSDDYEEHSDSDELPSNIKNKIITQSKKISGNDEDCLETTWIKEKLKKNIVKKSKCEDEDYQSPIVRTYLLDDMKPRVIQLNDSGSAYILVDYLPEELAYNSHNMFDQLWNLHPVDRHKIIMYEKEVEVSRYSKSYLNTWTDLAHTKSSSYMYSGFNTSSNTDPLPDEFVDYYNWAKSQDSRFNQVIANWYENESDYIAPHADCMRGMIPNAKISIMSFYSDLESSNFRFIEFTPKSSNSDCLADLVRIRLSHGSIITLCGTTNEDFVHEIPKTFNPVCSRISLSFRQMNSCN